MSKDINEIKVDIAKAAISSLCLNSRLNTLEISDQAVSIANNVYGLIYGKSKNAEHNSEKMDDLFERQRVYVDTNKAEKKL